MHTRLHAVSETLRQLLEDSMHADPGLNAFFTGANREVSLATPEEMMGTRQGLSLWLYRVARDPERLNDPPQRRPVAGGRVELVPAPLPLRLHYLATPLADAAPDTEQRILGRVLQAFHTQPIIAGASLQGDLAGTSARLHVHLEALNLDEIARVWEALQSSYQLSVSYEVTIANIDSDIQPLQSALVESVHPNVGVVVGS